MWAVKVNIRVVEKWVSVCFILKVFPLIWGSHHVTDWKRELFVQRLYLLITNTAEMKKKGQTSLQTAQLLWEGFTLKAVWLDPDCVDISWKSSTDKNAAVDGRQLCRTRKWMKCLLWCLIGSKRSGNFRTHGRQCKYDAEERDYNKLITI